MSHLKKIHVISHTHWDREWYQDFQGFRGRLIHMMDELIDHMENDPHYRYFTLDGQTVMLEDYLDIKPENRSRLEKLIQAGRIIIGPWYVMPDEFLVSGESLIRNLLKGFSQSEAWGAAPLKSGYLIDIFGHISQMPQILLGFDIDNAVIFRGFHGNADPAEIWWEGADGSRVLALKLDEDRSYSDFYFAIRWPFYDRDNAYAAHKEELIERAAKLLNYKSERATTSIGIGFDGVDHVEIEPQLPWLLDFLSSSEELNVQFIHSTIEDYLIELRSNIQDLQVYRGEQRSLAFNGLNNWTPENTLSSRIHLKQHNSNCEKLLEKWVEPFACFSALDGRAYSRRFIDKSWNYLLLNHPHDSICGCSIDQVNIDMMYRFNQSRLISEQLIKEQLEFIIHHIQADTLLGNQAFIVFNPSQLPLNGVVEFELVLPANSDVAVAMKGANLCGTSFRIFDADQQEIPYQVLDIVANSADFHRPYRNLPREERVDRFTIALSVNVPACGYSTYWLEKFTIETSAPLEYSAPKLVAPVRYPGSMRVDDQTWENGRIRLAVNPNGTLDITDLHTNQICRGLLVFEDEADIGDGWSHMPPINNATVLSSGNQITLSTIIDGPFLSRILIQTSLKVPKAIETDRNRRSKEYVELPIEIYVDLKKDDSLVYSRIVVQNTAADHRLRLLFPTLPEASFYHTSTPFDLVKREFVRPDHSTYLRKPFDVVPYNGLLAVESGNQGVAIFSKGLYEVSARDNRQRTIALTLFRSTQGEVFTDGGTGGQLLGNSLEFHIAFRPFNPVNDSMSDLWKQQQQYAAGVRVINRRAGKIYRETPVARVPDLPLTHSYLDIKANSDLILSSFKAHERDNNSYIVRLHNISEQSSQGSISFDRPLLSAHLANLNEQELSELPFNGNLLTLTAEAKQIITLKVSF